MIQKLEISYQLAQETVEKCLRDHQKRVDAFLNEIDSPTKLFFFYQPRQFKKPELYISVVGDGDKLSGKCCYFIRNSNKPIKTGVASDSTVVFGELNTELLLTFESSLSQMYAPTLKASQDWGAIRPEDREEMLNQIEKFNVDLKKKIRNLRGDVELRTPEPPHDTIDQKPAAYANAAKDSAVLKHFCEIVESWCTQLTDYMKHDPSNEPLDASCDDGPDGEIDYWSRRMLTLISVTEQLKTKPSRVVTGVLKARALRTDASGESFHEQEEIRSLIERWREVDLTITDSLNEAKDNQRFLANLQITLRPLAGGKPDVIAESMPSVMNSMKMIHTLSRHYGTEVRMTNLFVRITNILIERCKDEIYQGATVSALWEQEPGVSIDVMKECIKLFEKYSSTYADTKFKLAQMPKGKQFNFDESAIFGKSQRFVRRLEKLIDMFSSLQQFRALEAKRIDGMEKLVASFDFLIEEFKSKGHDLLNFNNTQFERDFVEFTMHNSGLENAIQDFMQRSLGAMSNIEKQLDLLKKFHSILHREALLEDLQHKYLLVFKLYGEDLQNIQMIYEKLKENPPIPRNMTRIAGNIHWSRQLLRRITGPMQKFQGNPKVFHPKESKRTVKHYNKLARTLIEFETLWFQAWNKSCDKAKRGLRARLIVEDGPKLFVNFDLGVLQMMREAKHLALMGFKIPNPAKSALVFEDKLKSHYNALDFALKKYNAILAEMSNVTNSMVKPHLKDLSQTMRPALTTMTWTSMNVSSFIETLEETLVRFSNLVRQTNDIINNRIHHNLEHVHNMRFLNMPDTKSFTLREFKATQEKEIAKCTDLLIAKNLEVERAVDDLIDTVLAYPLAENIEATNQLDVNFVKVHYSHLLYFALLTMTSESLAHLRRRILSSRGGFSITKQSLFEVELSLQVPNVVLTPSTDEMQEVIEFVAKEILMGTKKIMDWGIDSAARPRPPRPFFDKIAADKSVVVSVLLLTGAVSHSKKQAKEYFSKYDEYSWLWLQDPEQTYNKFLKQKQPILEDFLAELQRFVNLDRQLSEMSPQESIGALRFSTEKLKIQLKAECERWKFQYSEKLHQEVKHDMEKTTDLMSDLKSKLERDTKDFVNVKFVMDAMAEVRDVQSWIQAKFSSIIARYNVLENYLPVGVMTKEEMDAKSVLTKQWQAILGLSQVVIARVNDVAPGFKSDLIQSVAEFQVAVKSFRADYDLNGPMVPGTGPREAITRLGKYRREFETLKRKFELYHGGEKLFGLPCIEYPELVQTNKELGLLDRLYSLYQIVISTIDEYKSIPWSDVVANILTMNETVEAFASKCRVLPKSLRTWEAYMELSQTIEDFIDVLPLLNELSKSSMRDRHWKQISKLTGMDFDFEKFHELKLKSVIEADLLAYREDIEEITDGADKQLGIENKLREIEQIWDVQSFEFGTWKERGEVILGGAAITEIVEALEESQAILVQMLTQKHVTPFKGHASAWLTKLSDVNDTLESWIKVQMLWMSLEAVFTGGDIARQMPQDTRVFQKVDKEWTTRLMTKAHDVLNVVECCQNEYIKNMLPTMFFDLEKCQKALDGYLEAKRSKFPRFYFVSNPALLLILSQGSDKEAVQDAFPKIFDAIDRVEFQGHNIIKIRGLAGGYGKMDSEDIDLVKPVPAKGNIEDWLAVLLNQMMHTVHDIVRRAAGDFESMPLLEFIAKYPGQVSLLGVQFLWTSDVSEALVRSKIDKSAVPNAYKNQARVLSELSQLTTTEIPTKMERTKIETLVTIQVHQKDVVEELLKLWKEKKLKDTTDFEWQKQLRCYWHLETDSAIIKVADVEFAYCNEYLGCKERLVITPLTDRCYISLTQALGMCFGGAPAGPAGTGKTETTKDLGRGLGKYVVVFNCSDQMHTADTAKIYKGLCQSGSWGCFDEFNRIDLEVLSVVAQQVEAILVCLRTQGKQFSFPGDDDGLITVDTRCGFFITMNPGYAGRQELPENLKALFRGVAMMVPDREIIMKVKLASVGYNNYAELAQKFQILYALSEEQLSKQRHYDFGLRNVLSVLRTGGVNLRIELKKAGGTVADRGSLEEMLMMRTLRDMNLAKLVADDVGLFISLLHDLFPNQPDPEKRRYDEEEEAMKKIISDWKLINHENWVAKIIQLYETSLVRHGLMMVGPAGGGKTVGTKVLIEALSTVKQKAQIVRMNPKSITAEEMFGQNDIISGEWTHGIFSSIWQKYNDPKKNTTWIVCDGPVDAIWIENLNTVLDDNKLLTLANGDRIPMTDNVRILFEVQDLRNASPATVSRAGIVFVSSSDLGYLPIVEAWMHSRREEEATMLFQLWEYFVVAPDMLKWLEKNTENAMKASQTHLVTNLFVLLKGLLFDSEKDQHILAPEIINRYFIYSLCWSLGSLLEATDRKKFSRMLCKMCMDYPTGPIDVPEFADDECLFEYFVDPPTGEWKVWTPPPYVFDYDHFDFATALIPTVDSVRAEFLLNTMTKKCNNTPVLIVGSSGTAKTSIVLQYTNRFDASVTLLKKVNFSSATTAGMFQNSMEADIEKRQGKTFAPPGGRKMTVFLDDVSMPEVNLWGDQPTLEIVRQVIEERGFMFLEKDKRGDKMEIENVGYVGAMNHPGGGRNDIPNRLKRHFFTVNCTPPSKASIDNIYGTMLRGHFEDMSEQEALIDGLTKGTIDLWVKVKAKMLPTPSKFHYIFNMRDLSRVFQGILFCPHDTVEIGNTLLQLWFHECERVLSDKLVNLVDKNWYRDAAWKTCREFFGDEATTQLKDRVDPIYFVDFLRDDEIDDETDEVIKEAEKLYEPVPALGPFRQRVDNFLHDYNRQQGVKKMDLVLFTDALEHMLRISRILGMPRGNALLVGVGGSGRQSLTRLAAYIAKHEIFQIKLSRSYKIVDFLDDIRTMYEAVGKDGKKVTWIFTDFEIIKEEFLEYVNAILSTGEVAGLIAKDERDMMCADLRGPAKEEIKDFEDTPENLYKYFLNRIRSNLHIVLVFSPANEKFSERARKFPALIGCCTIDWFFRWPEQALVDVSHKFLASDPNFKIEATEKTTHSLVAHIASVHNLVTEACDEYFNRFRRAVHVTPKSYLAFIKGYKSVYTEKLSVTQQQEKNVTIGLQKLAEAEEDVDKMKGILEDQNISLQEADKAANAMLEKVERGSKDANIKKTHASGIEEQCRKTAEQIKADRAVANKELESAMPFVYAATEAAKKINKNDLNIITKFAKPPDLIKRIMDCVLILFQRRLDPVKMSTIKTGKDTYQQFVMDSYDTFAKKVMMENDFLQNVLSFAEIKKDLINPETIELLDPYLDVHDFNAERAKTVSSAAEGLCKWVRAMHSYHAAALIVAPLLEQLNIKTALFEAAQAKLEDAKASSQEAQDEVDKLQAMFDTTMREKAALEQQAKDTVEKMSAANNLIRSLGGEKIRWRTDLKEFRESKVRLVGDVALSCAFVSYLGPFNQDFRRHLLDEVFFADATSKMIPITNQLSVTKFLVDDGMVATWNSQGLPKDDLSIQNGILVTQASRYPLLVDPQSQALNWLKSRLAPKFPNWGTTTLTSTRLRDELEFCMEEGKPLLVEGIVKDVDPMFDPVFEQNFILKGRTRYILLGDKMVAQDKDFQLFMLTKLTNPLFSPELSAKTTIIDFSVTQKGLEDQLLSRVIQFEQSSLEEQRKALVEAVNMNTISLQKLDEELLDRLSQSKGNLLDDVALIQVLADTKTKAQEVKEKIEASKDTEEIINKKREQYRPVACRASTIYFVVVSLPIINVMYQISLSQYLQWFDFSMQTSEKANLVQKRVDHMINFLTFHTYVNISRGLFEADKLTYKMILTMKILLAEQGHILNERMVTLLLRGGNALTEDQAPRVPFDWLQTRSWLNLCQVSNSLDFFGDLRSTLELDEAEWKRWYEAENPEELAIPSLEERLESHPSGQFMRMLLIRSFRDDRFGLAANTFVGKTLGTKFTDPQSNQMEDIWSDANKFTPVILLLTPGADPTTALQDLAKKKGAKIFSVSMGEGQEKHARKCVDQGMEEGGWALLQNCHLGLGFMNELDDNIKNAEKQELAGERTVDPAYRTWITCEPHKDFPITLLQMSIKVTNEPPAGMKAGLYRSYTSSVDTERLNRVDTKDWRTLMYCICFLHSAVQERRKFGAVGWCIPYEFNQSDLEASLTMLEKHFFNSANGLSWPTIQYMVCEVQYGGRITDDFDRILFNTFGDTWLTPATLDEEFLFCSANFQYNIPQVETIEAYLQHIAKFPAHDTPEIFGLHTNADLTFGTSETQRILGSISDTQPKDGTKGSGKTREETVFEQADELLQLTPPNYKDADTRDLVRKRPKAEVEFVLGYRSEERVDGFSIPLNVFLYQEVTRLDAAIRRVRKTFSDLKQAINGEIVMTPELQSALNSIYDAKPPVQWYIDASGAEIAWSSPTLALWFNGLLERNKQLNAWLTGTRPLSYWMTGFFNPQGFLTAARQEITRRHKAEKWALDDVVLRSEVTDHVDRRRIKEPPAEGFYVHGLFLEGASWDRGNHVLKESAPKELFTPLPVLKIGATTSVESKKIYSRGTYYDCPCYTKPKRTDLAYVFVVKLESDVPQEHWVLRGVALLCSKD